MLLVVSYSLMADTDFHFIARCRTGIDGCDLRSIRAAQLTPPGERRAAVRGGKFSRGKISWWCFPGKLCGLPVMAAAC